jgi:hypothetical protein
MSRAVWPESFVESCSWLWRMMLDLAFVRLVLVLVERCRRLCDCRLLCKTLARPYRSRWTYYSRWTYCSRWTVLFSLDRIVLDVVESGWLKQLCCLRCLILSPQRHSLEQRLKQAAVDKQSDTDAWHASYKHKHS